MLYQFSITTAINCHKLGGLKQPKFINLQLFRSEVWHDLTGLESRWCLVCIPAWRFYRGNFLCVFKHHLHSYGYVLFPASLNPTEACRTGCRSPTYITSLWLLPPFATCKDACKYIGPSWIIQDNLLTSRSLNLILSAKCLSLCKVTNSQIPGWLECGHCWGPLCSPPQYCWEYRD